MPDVSHRADFTRSQLPEFLRNESNDETKGLMDQIRERLIRSSQGIVVNSFAELEPVSLCNTEMSDKFDRGNKASIDKHNCLNWLDSKAPDSVIYACFGTLSHISPTQIIEIGLGLESSNRPFIWIIRARDCSKEIQKWLEEEKFEERVKGRGRWAPQALILSHSSVGGFLTHCGWNSTLEGICAGLPMITWPIFAEQFYNQNFVVNVLRIGVRIGVAALKKGEDDNVVLVNREKVKKAIDSLMDGEEGEVRIRKRARVLGEIDGKEGNRRRVFLLERFIVDSRCHE